MRSCEAQIKQSELYLCFSDSNPFLQHVALKRVVVQSAGATRGHEGRHVDGAGRFSLQGDHNEAPPPPTQTGKTS